MRGTKKIPCTLRGLSDIMGVDPAILKRSGYYKKIAYWIKDYNAEPNRILYTDSLTHIGLAVISDENLEAKDKMICGIERLLDLMQD